MTGRAETGDPELKPATLEEQARKGRAALRFLEDPMFQEACRQIADGLAHQRRSVPMRDTDMHTRLIVAEQTWGQVLDYVQMVAKTGRWAQFELTRRESRSAALLRRIRAPLRG